MTTRFFVFFSFAFLSIFVCATSGTNVNDIRRIDFKNFRYPWMSPTSLIKLLGAGRVFEHERSATLPDLYRSPLVEEEKYFILANTAQGIQQQLGQQQWRVVHLHVPDLQATAPGRIGNLIAHNGLVPCAELRPR